MLHMCTVLAVCFNFLQIQGIVVQMHVCVHVYNKCTRVYSVHKFEYIMLHKLVLYSRLYSQWVKWITDIDSKSVY